MLNKELIVKDNNRIIERNEREIETLLEKKEEINKLLSQLYRQNFELIESNEELEGEL